jgi:pimeloyl-ACP methyl ester carboxylesterase
MQPRDIRRLRGLKSLVHDAVDESTELVDVGHESTMRVVTKITDQVEPLRGPVRAVDTFRRLATRGILRTVRIVNRSIEVVTDGALDVAERLYVDEEMPALVPMRSDTIRTGRWIADAAEGVVNAAVGDHLETKKNGLDMSMLFRLRDRYVSLDGDGLRDLAVDEAGRVALFVHGLGTTEWSWCLEGETYHGDPSASFGTLLERDVGHTPIYLRYNTGRHVSDNGRALAAHLERLVSAYPVPISDLTLIGHSMGGLVIRSACHYGERAGHQWTSRVRRVFCLGSPHRGAPLAKLGHVLGGVLETIDLPATRIGARILSGQSAGIRDLRHGAVIDEDWLRTDAEALSDAALLPHAAHYFVSASITRDSRHPIGRLLGDLMVRLPSSSGPLLRERHFAIATSHQGGVMHHQLQNHPALYGELRRACAE